jgi:hypothetical protein
MPCAKVWRFRCHLEYWFDYRLAAEEYDEARIRVKIMARERASFHIVTFLAGQFLCFDLPSFLSRRPVFELPVF